MGYRAQVKGKKLVVSAGYSHPVEMDAPEGVTFAVENNTSVTVSGADKELVGNRPPRFAASVRPSPTRAKGSSTRGNASSARPERPARNKAALQPTAIPLCPLHARNKPRSATGACAVTSRAHPTVPAWLYRSNEHIYAQVIDDAAQHTLAAASSLDKDLRTSLNNGANCDASTAVGQLVAKRAIAKGIQQVVFDRGGNLYHGRVKALAEAAREAGLQF